ncbi:hypothetical protein SAMN04489841_0216 [Natrinema salaciae]|uniref:Uncharacterized protein n=2 Tax=Natrinema salaciae TaxID=1186196 RepID=A0A1H8ZN22_9EURY|nr:hypothetical protein SAMN04489841_0216 [Natrinema salaciae]
MKRTITVLLTLALITSAAFVGLAGTAAAGGADDHHDDHGDTDDLRIASSNIDQSQGVSQTNDIEQNAAQFNNQEATGIDIGEIVNDGDGNGDNGDGGEAAIETITWYRNLGQSGNIQQLAQATWNGEQFVITTATPNIDVSVSVEETNSADDPTEVDWEYTIPGQGEGRAPDFVRVTSNGDTCDFDVTGEESPFTGTVTVCEPTDGGNGDGNGNGDGAGSDDSFTGTTGDQTINQVLEQNADADNSNSQNAEASSWNGILNSITAG